MMFLRRRPFLLLFGTLASFLLICYFVNERETEVSRRRVMERPLETIQPEEKGISNSFSNFLKEKNHHYNPTED